ncbi:MAG: hypothetical protein Q8T11_07925 [Elusimicrobiota bacterium]|nr:hypothetical protein [Elusimicrobiota bacterium]
MNFAKCLLVALALWMPAASFTAAAANVAVEHAAPCAEAPAVEEVSEQNEMFLPARVTPVAIPTLHTFDHFSQRALDGHVAELIIPPPNPASQPR